MASDDKVTKVGYIGLGNAGFSMASNIPKRGYKLIVHDADQTKADRAAKEWESTSASGGKPDAFAECQVIITMLPQGKIVREVLLGDRGSIAGALKPGTIVVDTSSSSPFDTKSLGEALAHRHLSLIDCPITQTYMHAADAGQSTAMVGSDSDEAFRKVKPALECMFSYIFHMGPLGSGHAMKTLNNYIMASSINALCDSLVAGQKFGLDPQQMIDVLIVGTRACAFRPWIRSGGTGLQSATTTELPALLQRNLQYSLDQVEPDADHTKCLPGWELRSGVKLKRTEKVKDIAKEDFDHRLNGLNRPA